MRRTTPSRSYSCRDYELLVVQFEGKLLLILGLIVLEVKSVLKGIAASKVGFGGADDSSVLDVQLEILSLELVRDIEVCLVLNFLVCKQLRRPGRFPQKFLNFGFHFADEFFHHFFPEWDWLIGACPLIECTDEFILSNGDLIRGRVGHF